MQSNILKTSYIQREPSDVFQTLQQSSTEVSNEKIKQGLDGNDPEVFAAVLTESVQKSLEKNSYGKTVTVRVGDYVISPMTLSTIYAIKKDDFELNYRDLNAPDVSLVTADVTTVGEKIRTDEIDEANNKIEASEE